MARDAAVEPSRWLLLLAIVLAALNLRTAVTSVGPLLDEITAGLGMSSAVAGLLTTLPVACFAGFGSLAPMLARRFGLNRTMLGAFLLTALGMASRAVAGQAWAFLAASVFALAGGAIGNVLIPVLVKRWFPDRLGALTTVYTTTIAVGMTFGAALAVPISRASGAGWRLGVGAWAALALLAALPWLGLRRARAASAAGRPDRLVRSLVRDRLAWAMAVFFAAQSAQAYVFFGWLPAMFRDDGVSANTAGLLLAFLSGLSVPVSLVVSPLTARFRDQRPLVLALVGCTVLGLVGMLLRPAAGAWLWALLLGVGAGCFPMALTMIAVKTRTAADTVALSAFTQGLGYLMSGVGPLAFGVLHGLTGGWTAPMLALFGVIALQLVSGWYAAGDRVIGPAEDAEAGSPGLPPAASHSADATASSSGCGNSHR
jgi:CP family cyanate transporter-like MFS transporter